MSYHLAGFLATGTPPQRQGTATAFIAPYETFPTATGDILICAANDNQFYALAHALDLSSLANEPRFATNPQRVAHRAELRAVLAPALAARPASEWECHLADVGVPSSAVRNVAALAQDAQLEHLSLLGGLPTTEVPDLRLVQLPISANGERGAQRNPPPLLGEHTDEILTELGLTLRRGVDGGSPTDDSR